MNPGKYHKDNLKKESKRNIPSIEEHLNMFKYSVSSSFSVFAFYHVPLNLSAVLSLGIEQFFYIWRFLCIDCGFDSR